ncbi:elongation factor P 5-aminopentanone reductase [Peribacillus tepidiphilus]|uniref:elongation factor P 5-aminopentanone reductase n=1 Tax=Peribacillus tepidiphilus TaxID=2652445 RepID=UPI0012908ED0|nr:SDR family oxidoreductase [Peribacillus tepidiphilus]
MNKKFILITGASGGIGKSIAWQLAKEGYSLYLHFHSNEDSIRDLLVELESFKGEYIPIRADLSKQQGVKELCEGIFSLHGIVLNSGRSHFGLISDFDEETVLESVQLGITSPFFIVQKLLPKLKANQSSAIVAVTSIWGQTGAACEVLYSMLKGGQNAFVKALSKELALSGIRVNAVAPGAVSTNMLSQFSEEELSMLSEEIPMGRIGNPEEIAEVVAFLLSDKASYITGQIIGVNGGWYM